MSHGTAWAPAQPERHTVGTQEAAAQAGYCTLQQQGPAQAQHLLQCVVAALAGCCQPRWDCCCYCCCCCWNHCFCVSWCVFLQQLQLLPLLPTAAAVHC